MTTSYNNPSLDFRFLENNELSLKIKDKSGLQSIFSHRTFHSGTRGLSYKDILDLPNVPSLSLSQTELCIIDNCDKLIFFPKKTKKEHYWKGMNPGEYEYVFGIKYKGVDNDNYWYKACFRNILDNKFAFLSSTDNYLKGNSLVPSLIDGWYVSKNGIIAPALFWYYIKNIIIHQYKMIE
jgi:hypothetical protein